MTNEEYLEERIKILEFAVNEIMILEKDISYRVFPLKFESLDNLHRHIRNADIALEARKNANT